MTDTKIKEQDWQMYVLVMSRLFRRRCDITQILSHVYHQQGVFPTFEPVILRRMSRVSGLSTEIPLLYSSPSLRSLFSPHCLSCLISSTPGGWGGCERCGKATPKIFGVSITAS
jgi:hypothetical protein